MTCSLLNKERNPGHSSIMTGFNSGRRKKSNDWPIGPKAKMPFFSLEKIWKRKFSSGQTLARERCQFSQLQVKSPVKRIFSSGQTLVRERHQFSQLWGKSPIKRVEQSLWTEVSRKVLIQPILGISLVRKKERKEYEHVNLVKDKYNLNCFSFYPS